CFAVALSRRSFSLQDYQQPPRPPLFPYTTLFRSEQTEAQAGCGEIIEHLLDMSFSQVLDGLGLEDNFILHDEVREIKLSSRPRPDRKSTRLNSSHVKISYAVFCLKKKKKNTTKNT